jgi:hypothetical protein
VLGATPRSPEVLIAPIATEYGQATIANVILDTHEVIAVFFRLGVCGLNHRQPFPGIIQNTRQEFHCPFFAA